MQRSPQRRQVLRSLAASLAAPWPLLQHGLANAAAPTTGSKIWRLAVVPQLTPVEMTRNWSPIVQALTQAGFPCELVVHPSIANFEPEFLRGQADLVFLNPYHMVMAHRAHRYVPLLRDTRPLEGVLVVKNDSAVTAIEQLMDQRLSFPAPNAFAASLYIRAVLARQHHLRFETHYAMNHRNAVRQVLARDSMAAGVVKTTLEMESPEIQHALRVIYTTPRLSPHPLAVHPRVPTELRSVIIKTLQVLAQDQAGKPLMAAIQMPAPIKADYQRDYAPMAKLGLETYVVRE